MRTSQQRPQIKSSIVIAKMLDSEGYTPKVHNGLRRYSKRLMPDRILKKYERVAKAMSTIAQKLSAGDRLVIGRFISWQNRMALDTGLRIGLAASLTALDDPSDSNTGERK